MDSRLFMRLLTNVILRGNNHIINWSTTAEYYLWALENEASLRNLDNYRYWRSFMTDAHKEMNRHPNRSYQWVPQDIAKVRDAIADQQKDYVLGPNGWSRAWRVDHCMSCGVSTDDLSKYQSAVDQTISDMEKAWMEKYPELIIGKDDLNRGYLPEEEWYKIRELAVAQVNPQFDSWVVDRGSFNLPNWKSRIINQATNGHCFGCWEQIKPRLGWTSRMEVMKNDLS